MPDKRLEEEDRRYEATLHDHGDGRLRVGASPFYIRQHPEGDWGVYAYALAGDERIPGAWCFKRRQDAEARAFAFARQSGWAR